MQNNKVVKKRKKINYTKLLLIFLFLCVLCYFVFFIITKPISNIYIYNNVYLSDQKIIDISNIRNYPSFLLTSKNKIKKQLLKKPLVYNVEVKKKFFGEIHITVEENKPLFYNENTNQTILSNGKKVDDKFKVPILTNEISYDIEYKLINKMKNLCDTTLLKMSEIKYSPNEIDKERMFITMTDGNYVYLTLYTFEKIDNYNKVLPSLGGKKGILYFDSGNFFEILN